MGCLIFKSELIANQKTVMKDGPILKEKFLSEIDFSGRLP
jgi:hypothetical protein